MQTQTFLDSYSISDAQFIEIADNLGLDPSVDTLSDEEQSQILEEATKTTVFQPPSTQSQRFDPSEHNKALAALQNETATKLEAFLDQSENIAIDVEDNCLEVIEVVSDRIADAVQSIMPGVVHRTTEKLQNIIPEKDGVSLLGKHQNRFQVRLQRLKGSRVMALLPASK